MPDPSPDAHLGEGPGGELQLLLEQVAQHLVLPLQLEDTFLQLDALLTQVLAGVWGVSQDPRSPSASSQPPDALLPSFHPPSD